MKFNSKLLLEELIRTHILEAVGDVISDTNVARGKLSGTKFINGNIANPGNNVSSADKQFFEDIKSELSLTSGPYVKIVSNVKGDGNVSETDRINNLTLTASQTAGGILGSHVLNISDSISLKDYDAIISKPQGAKLTSASKSETVPYESSGKLYYTVVFVKKIDINNNNVSPTWGVNRGIRYYAQDQLNQLKSAEPSVLDIDDTTDDQSIVSKTLTSIEQQRNAGFQATPTMDKRKDLQRLIWTWWQVNKEGANTNVVKTFTEFSKLYIMDATPADWNGDISTNSDVWLILKHEEKTDDDFELLQKLHSMSLVETLESIEELTEIIRKKIKNFKKSKLVEQTDTDATTDDNSWEDTNNWWDDVIANRNKEKQKEIEKKEIEKKKQEDEKEKKKQEIYNDVETIFKTKFLPTYEGILQELKSFFENYDQFKGYKKWYNDDEADAYIDIVKPWMLEKGPKFIKELDPYLANTGYKKAVDTDNFYDLAGYWAGSGTDAIAHLYTGDYWGDKMLENYIQLKVQIMPGPEGQFPGSEQVDGTATWMSSLVYNYARRKSMFSIIHSFIQHLDWDFYYWGADGGRKEFFINPDF